MKINYFLIMISLLVFNNSLFSQNKQGREALKYCKVSLEDMVRQFGVSISDTSMVYKKYYIIISTQYNKAKASYEGYRGFMYDCIINNSKASKIQKCLKSKNFNVQQSLDSLQDYIKAAYFEEYLNHPSNPDILHKDTNQNVGVITADFINSILDTLTNAAIKIWEESRKMRKEKKDELLKEIKSDEYALTNFDTIIKKPRQ